MNSRDHYQRIISFLKCQHYHIQDTWVHECVDFYLSSKPNVSFEELKREVVQQWLLVDLRELKVPSLPINLAEHHKIVLSSTYAVQVEAMVDIGHSAYSQLQIVKKVSTENIKTTEEKGPKEVHCRCLWLTMSDGVQEVKGMEYKPIKSLALSSQSLLPGFKMLIIGPVTCRKGVFLLTEQNIKICGGEVDTLLISNSYENLLARSLGTQENSNLVFRDTEPIPTHESRPTVSISPDINHWEEDFDIPPSVFDTVISENSLTHSYNTSSNAQPIQSNNDFPSDNDLEEFVVMNNEHNFEEIPFYDEATPSCSNIYMRRPTSSSNKSALTDVAHKLNFTALENPSYLNSMKGSMEQNIGKMMSTSIQIQPSNTSLSSVRNIKKQQIRNIVIDDPAASTANSSNFLQSSKLNEPAKVQQSLTSYFEKTVSSTPKLVSCQPFVYLKQISGLTFTKPYDFIVKAEILTLKTKLILKSECLSLQACITDGSDVMDVQFTSLVLEEILGFSGCEIEAMKKQRLENPALGNKIKKTFELAQQKLISLNCLMTIRICPLKSNLPSVIKLEEINLRHFELLKKRMQI